MKLLVLLLLVLSAGSFSSCEEDAKPVLLLDPSLKDGIPNVTDDATTDQDLSTTLKSKIKSARYSSSSFDQTALEWQLFEGYVPDGAVSIYNEYVGRIDYVCQYDCIPGFYRPDIDFTPSCHYPYDMKENLSSPFFILVNENNFEVLEWKEGSYGSVPQNSVNTCHNTLYVGKNEYGLGKVDVKDQVFYLPWEGSEYSYSYYQVLTSNRDVYSEHISNVEYYPDGVKPVEYPTETLDMSYLTNQDCQAVTLTATLSKMIQVEERWDTSFSMTSGVKVTITAEIPIIDSTSIEFSEERTLQFTEGTTYIESNTHTVSVQSNVPPNYSCRVIMMGYKYGAVIPFKARLSRTYNSGETDWTSISGTYEGVQMTEVRAMVDPCEPVPYPTPCLQKD